MENINIQFSIVTKKDEFYSLRDFWNALLEGSTHNTLFLTFEWISAYIEIYGQNNLFIIIAKHHNDIIGICPFKLTKMHYKFGIPAREISFICDTATDYQDFIIKKGYESIFYKDFINFLKDQTSLWNVLRLSFMTVASSSMLHITKFVESVYNYRIIDAVRCLYVKLSNEQEKKRLADVIRETKDTKRRLRWLEEKGNVQYARYKTKDIVLSKIDLFLDMHQKRWMHSDANYMNNGIIKRNFINKLLENMAENSFYAELVVLELNKIPIACHLHFNRAGIYSHYNCAFDPAFSDYSPGKILNWYLMQDLLNDKTLHEIDFLRGEEEYKKVWARTYRMNKTLIIYNTQPSLYSFTRSLKYTLSKKIRLLAIKKNTLRIFSRNCSETILSDELKNDLAIDMHPVNNNEIDRLLCVFWSEGRNTRFKNYNNRNYTCVIAYADDFNPVGYCWIAYDSIYLDEIEKWITLKKDECAFIDFYVEPMMRKMGVYKQLCRTAIMESGKKGFKTSYIWCLDTNEASMRTFNYFGFHELINIKYLNIGNQKVILKENNLNNTLVQLQTKA